jgi:hypothetical protein
MSALDRVLPTPRMLELDGVDLAIPPDQAWEIVRHGDLGDSPLIRALFAIRKLPDRLLGHDEEPISLRIDHLASSSERPGFQVLVDAPPREVVVGAIGKVWRAEIPFIHVPSPAAFAAFRDPGFVKVAWAIQLSPRGEHDTHLALEVRVDATDDESWRKFRTYFRLIGPGSHFIRHALLAALARQHGTPAAKENERPLEGDELLADASAQVTHGITIAAKPEAIWPWLVQMGCRRAGFYSYDALDNGGVPSAREIHSELQDIRVGQILPAEPAGDAGFEVLRIEPNRALILGGLYDPENKKQHPFASPRPAPFWHVTWAFVLEPLDEAHTRLHVRGRAAFPESVRGHAWWMRFVHHFMQKAQLRHLAARVEGRLTKSGLHEVAEGVRGAAMMVAALLTPFLREGRSHWGLDGPLAQRAYPGDELVAEPRWSWTHGVEIDGSAEEVWPWIAQIGADRAGFYSYQWLENLAGCQLRNAEAIHPAWAVREEGRLLLHPEVPALYVTAVAPGKYFVAHARADAAARAANRPWAEVSWLFFVEPIDERRCRFISRYRCACSDEIATQLEFGPTLLEPIGFAMDRRMLLGVKERVERRSGGGREP